MNQTGLSKKAKWLYGLCLMGGNFVYMLTASFTVMYYQTYLGLNAAFVGAVLMVARIFDAVNDPLTGIIVA
ncbi:MAG: MFS transporter, partial [Erysipelotrichaceae bacterium]|nr:MFS transporter [Erysipelotrichaceae bacterium]